MSLTHYWRERLIVAGRWTLKDVVQGKPFGHPSHPPFVHFPSALLPAALVFDVASRLDVDMCERVSRRRDALRCLWPQARIGDGPRFRSTPVAPPPRPPLVRA